jgi:hypothetical protein
MLLKPRSPAQRSTTYAAPRSPKVLQTLPGAVCLVNWPTIGANLTQVKEGKSMKGGRFQAAERAGLG